MEADAASIPLLALTFAGAKAAATVGACAAVGAYASWIGKLSGQSQKAIDGLYSSICLPCLVLWRVVPHMNSDILQIWPMALMCGCVVISGISAASLLSRVLSRRYPDAFPHYFGFVAVALAFPNAFAVPLTLMLALGEHPLLMEDLPPGVKVEARVEMLFVLSYAFWIVARWSIGYPMMSGAISFSEWRAKVLNPPIKACLIAAPLGLLWTATPTSIRSSFSATELFDPVISAVSYAGRCAMPLVLLGLGARLYAVVDDMRQSAGAAKGSPAARLPNPPETVEPELMGLQTSTDLVSSGATQAPVNAKAADGVEHHVPAGQAPHLPLPAYFAVLVGRQVLGPLLGGAVGLTLRRLCGVEDNLLLLVTMLQAAGPPMINISVMAGLSGNAEKETAKLLLLTYTFSIVSWTASMAFFLHLLQ